MVLHISKPFADQFGTCVVFREKFAEIRIRLGKFVACRYRNRDCRAGADAVLEGGSIIRTVLKQHKVVFPHQPGRLPVVGYERRLLIPGGSDDGIKSGIASGNDIVVVLIQTISIDFLLHDLGNLPSGNPAVDNPLPGILRIRK